MKTRRACFSNTSFQLRAFSLIELLTVIAVLSVLATALLPSLQGVMDGIQINGAASLVESEILLARQTAMTRNVPVEVRIYKNSDGDEDEQHWQTLAVVVPAMSSNEADAWISKPTKLPGNVIFDDGGNFSTILANARPLSSDFTFPSSSHESSTAPASVREKDYVAFRFAPNGSTYLNTSQSWLLTLKNLKSPPEGDRPSANFVSLVLDSLTGRVMTFQP
ncbi:MAG: Verru_Chthon cassette protein D [Chthoniobacterales bacterium]